MVGAIGAVLLAKTVRKEVKRVPRPLCVEKVVAGTALVWIGDPRAVTVPANEWDCLMPKETAPKKRPASLGRPASAKKCRQTKLDSYLVKARL